MGLQWEMPSQTSPGGVVLRLESCSTEGKELEVTGSLLLNNHGNDRLKGSVWVRRRSLSMLIPYSCIRTMLGYFPCATLIFHIVRHRLHGKKTS